MNEKHHSDNNGGKKLSRRTFLKALGLGTATAAAPVIVSCAMLARLNFSSLDDSVI